MKATDKLYGMNWVGQLQSALHCHPATISSSSIERTSAYMTHAANFLLQARLDDAPEGARIWARRYVELRRMPSVHLIR